MKRTANSEQRTANSEQRLGVSVPVQFARKTASYIFHGISATAPEPAAMVYVRSVMIPEPSAMTDGRSAVADGGWAMTDGCSAVADGLSATAPASKIELKPYKLTPKINVKWQIM